MRPARRSWPLSLDYAGQHAQSFGDASGYLQKAFVDLLGPHQRGHLQLHRLAERGWWQSLSMRRLTRASSETRELHESHVRTFVRDNVRAGLLTGDQLYAEVARAVREELPWLPAEETAREWIATQTSAWEADAVSWPAVTDYARLQAAFVDLEAGGVVVLQACEDHWAANAVLKERPQALGVAWFMPSDVWHAIDEGMLEVNLWHASAANVAPGDALLDSVMEVFVSHGLPAHFDEGRIEISALWQRHPRDARS